MVEVDMASEIQESICLVVGACCGNTRLGCPSGIISLGVWFLESQKHHGTHIQLLVDQLVF